MVKKRLMSILVFVMLFALPAFSGNIFETLQQKVSPNFVNVSLEEVLRIFARQYSLNMIVGNEVKGRVSIQLTDVPLGNALNTILKAGGNHYIVENNVILVKPYKDEVNGEQNAKVYKLNYIDGFHLKTIIEPLLSTKGKVEALVVDEDEDGKIQRSAMVVVNDLWENIRKIDQVVGELDKPSQQIQIEIRLIETLAGNEKRVGLNLPKSFEVSMMGAEKTAPITSNNQGSSGGEQTLLSAWYQLPEGPDKLNLGVITFDKLRATLDILAADNNSRLISNPRLTTLNNKKASIKIGTTIPIPEVSRGISGDLISYKEKDVSVNLDVIPQIGLDGKITLNVHPMLEEIIGYTGAADALQPITSVREVETTVMVNDGETVVIGGLIKESETKTVNKVWLLGDIPLLGRLFRHTASTTEKKDLLVFITTKIME